MLGGVGGPRALILAPTRELALQVAKATVTYGRHVQGLRVATVVGGVPYPAQIKALIERVVREQTALVDLVPLFSQYGHHHLPVVDERNHLVGILTESDMVRIRKVGYVSYFMKLAKSPGKIGGRSFRKLRSHGRLDLTTE